MRNLRNKKNAIKCLLVLPRCQFLFSVVQACGMLLQFYSLIHLFFIAVSYSGMMLITVVKNQVVCIHSLWIWINFECIYTVYLIGVAIGTRQELVKNISVLTITLNFTFIQVGFKNKIKEIYAFFKKFSLYET